MQIDQNKLARQELGVDKWFDNNCVGIFDWHTGVGKTYGAELCIRRNEKSRKDTYVIVVPSDNLLKQWTYKLEKSLPKYLLERVVIKTLYTLLSENIVYECGTLIVDEIHEFWTEDRLKILDRKTIVKCDRILGLTASADDKNFRYIKRFIKVIDSINKEEAEENGYVASFIEYNLALNLNQKEKEQYEYFTEVISKLMPKFQKDIGLAQKILTGGKDKHDRHYAGAGWAYGLAVKNGWSNKLDTSFESHKTIDDIWNPNVLIGQARQLMNAVRIRRELLCNCVSKYNATLEIVKKFNQVKTIIFSETTEFADKMNTILNENKFPSVVYHSNLKTIMATSEKSGKFIKLGKTRLKALALDKIKTGKARILNTTKALDRGLDVEDLRLSITTSGSQNVTQYKQRNGRASRKEKGIFGDVPILLINLYIIDTQDEKWLDTRQSNNKHKPIVVNSVEDINYFPPANIEFTINDI